MKFIHAADLHLDSPFLGMQQLPASLWQRLHDAPFQAVKRLVATAIEQQVDFVVLVGDLFDRETQSVRAQVFLSEQLQLLIDHHIGVFVSYGNHDHLTENQALTLPTEVAVFSADVETKQFTTQTGERVAITGFSYPQRWLDNDMITRFPERGTVDYQIGLLHGAVKQGDENHYAPFTVSELQATHYDYWALGHIHKPQLLASQPEIVYAGTIQGRNKLEDGPHGFELVSSSTGQLHGEFIRADQFEWLTFNIQVNADTTDESLMSQVEDAIINAKRSVFGLIELQISGIASLSPALVTRLTDGTWLARFDQNQRRRYDEQGAWVYSISVAAPKQTVTYAQLDAKYWAQAGDAVFTPDNLQQTAGRLMQYDFLATHIKQDETLKTITEAAKTELFNQARLEEEQDADHQA